MNVKNRELFNLEEVNNYISKFQGKLEESSKLINSYNNQLEQLEVDLDSAISANILDDTKESAVALDNLTAKKANIMNSLEIETKKAMKIKELLQAELVKVLPNISKQFEEDERFFKQTVEKDLFKKLYELKQKQEEYLLLLEASRRQVQNEIFEFNTLADFAGLTRLKRTADNTLFFQDAFNPNRDYAEYGSVLINCNNLSAIEAVLDMSRNNANGVYNQYREVNEQLPPAKKVADVDLAKYLKSIK